MGTELCSNKDALLHSMINGKPYLIPPPPLYFSRVHKTHLFRKALQEILKDTSIHYLFYFIFLFYFFISFYLF